jgi:hypothetical protein
MTNHQLSSIGDDRPIDDNISLNTLNSKSSSYHTYKYSRREQNHFYASVKRARLKKYSTSMRKFRFSSMKTNQQTLRINLPTRITACQRLNTNMSNSYPLLFDPNFHSLVALSTEDGFQKYLSPMKTYFHLIHSIASQEFQIIVHSHDHQQTILPYTAMSFLHVLRQTMFNYSMNLQRTYKRDYFQAFNHNQHRTVSNKIPRSEQSSLFLISDDKSMVDEDSLSSNNIDRSNPSPVVIQLRSESPVMHNSSINKYVHTCTYDDKHRSNKLLRFTMLNINVLKELDMSVNVRSNLRTIRGCIFLSIVFNIIIAFIMFNRQSV